MLADDVRCARALSSAWSLSAWRRPRPGRVRRRAAQASRRPAGRAPSQTTTLTFGIWGPPEEVRAYQEMVNEYNAGTEASDVTIESWPDSAR